MQKIQNDSFLCLMLMAQENIITAYIPEDRNEIFFIQSISELFLFVFWKYNIPV